MQDVVTSVFDVGNSDSFFLLRNIDKSFGMYVYDYIYHWGGGCGSLLLCLFCQFCLFYIKAGNVYCRNKTCLGYFNLVYTWCLCCFNI